MLLSSLLLRLGLGLFQYVPVYAQHEDANRALVESFVTHINAGEVDAVLDLFTSPDASYWLNGSPGRTCGAAGNSTVGTQISGLPGLIGFFDEFSLTTTNIVSQGDTVVLEALGRGEGPGTFLYLQPAVIFFRVVHGKLDSVREYLDHQELQYMITYRERYAPG
jgi:ketosteroid isomerase-like protein